MSSRRELRRAATVLAALVMPPVACLWPFLAVPVASAAGKPTGPALLLDGQSEWVEPPSPGAPAAFDLTLTVTGAGSTEQVNSFVYRRLATRSTLQSAASHGPRGAAVTSTGWQTVAKLPADSHVAGAVDFDAAVVAQETVAASDAGPTLVLHCTAAPTGTNTCPGVYPVVVELRHIGSSPVAKFTTFLTYVEAKSSHPLDVALVVPLSAPPHLGGASPGDGAIGPIEPSDASALEGLVSALRSTAVPVTLEPSPQTMQALSSAGKAGRTAVDSVAAMSDDQAVDEVPAQPYVPVDLGALAGAGESTEIAAQMAAGRTALHSYRIATAPAATGVPWVATGPVGGALLTGLADIHEDELVVPNVDLTAFTGVGTPTSTFHLTLKGASTTPLVADADGTLTDEFATSGDPALAASRMLADLAMIHFEEPNLDTTRGVVVVPPTGWRPDAAFDSVLLAGLQANPDVAPVTLSQYFKSVASTPTGTRQPKTATPGLGRSVATKLSLARVQLSAFDRAVPRGEPILARLDQILLCSEYSGFDRRRMLSGIDLFDTTLHTQLSRISIAGGTVTLTAQTGVIPVTVLNGLHYTVRGVLTISGVNFEFPDAHGRTSTRHPMTLGHLTNPWRFDVVARSSGEQKLRVTFSISTRGGTLVMASEELVVRSTATSVVGVVLTAAALAVLLAWWARTWLSGRRRAAREAT